MQVEPYLNFNGRCDEAIDFYRRAVGAEVTMLMRFKDAPPTQGPSMISPGSENKVMHASLRIGDTDVLASDGRCAGTTNFQGFSLALTAESEAEAQRMFAALSDGGKVEMPLAKTFFSPAFGMVTDRFGLMWMVLVRQ
jgi:PhnB protein